MNKQRLVVVGNGMVGHHFVEQLVAAGALAQFELTVLGAEADPAYDRVHLSEVFGGRAPEALRLADPAWYAGHDIDLRLGAAVEAIDRGRQQVILGNGEAIDYDRLVLATGSVPFVPPVPGRERSHCFVYRTLGDLAAIREACAHARSGVVIGGGLLGLEAANALRLLGLKTHVVEFAPRLMPVQLDELGGELLASKIGELGVAVHLGKATERIVDGEQARHRLEFADGSHLECDVLLFSAGIRPADALARGAGLAVGERGGIVIDEQCQSSDPAILAIGECALWQGRIFGLVAPGYQMARAAVATLCGGESRFGGADMSTKLKLMGVDVGAIGDGHGATPGAQTLLLLDRSGGVYKKLVVDERGERLLGAILVGDGSDYDRLLAYYQQGMALPTPVLALLTGEGEAAAAPLSLPDSATLCSCHNVSKAAVVAAVREGHHELGQIKGVTRAGTGCGGCSNLLKQVLDQTLSELGLETNHHLCEHFAFSRQELCHLIRVEQIRDFDSLLARHGQGLGCEVCKPAIASILASLWNEHVLAKPHRALQDTNDRFLANVQRDGTYSVVPRIAGGEITPRGLIILGEIAERYGLFTKITGGQRIDMLGARRDQLPAIWGELVAAGFETGQAYGKSVRTVKSCVGSTWCRYGVQDSLAMTQQLEHRYKGLRAPHKLKFAVSGCTRECAEAQSKDIGVIATERGWNLYVCGNGGMRPRHADLFATDLDDQTLIRYIDRLLMFYVRTGDRLQRTSVWLEGMEGGLDYLKGVIIDDRLGIGAELEAAMASVVGSWECEWKATLADPDKLRLFEAHLNAPEEPTPPRRAARGQWVPAIDIKEVV
ncbi:nitrite reductase large subunit NirB [Aeromonas simiae]|uniref:nitrite reductase large subunit NirB n=1 Tax=Aeromonas simiae TaxID=218936 RepID=UPI00266CAA80|nr:nitrite reductase large subunit NirB [Aeromonas simiae]MDO2950220.1 nitrite reductase large subunit NirB [Aeromonas simiae]MDO2953889.1 nitrite reductase large subunit NirB [Aeromonas simiae]MDO2957631.1 nitrite reductase large subunit NirB [Aeromonas simiae]